MVMDVSAMLVARTTYSSEKVSLVGEERKEKNDNEKTHLPRPLWCRFENPRLHIRRKVRINRTNHQLGDLVPQRPRRLLQVLLRGFDLVLTGQEDEDVTARLGRMNLEDGRDGGVEVVRFGLRGVENVDGVATTGNCERRRVSRGKEEEREGGTYCGRRERRQSTRRTWSR